MTSGYYRDTCLNCKNTMNPEKCHSCLSTEDFQNFEPHDKDLGLERARVLHHQFGIMSPDSTESLKTTKEEISSMFLVWIKWVGGAQPTMCVVARTREEAQTYIAKKMEGYRPSGLGVYAIEEVPVYEEEKS